MKALPVKLVPVTGYVPCEASEATHVTLNIPGPTGRLTPPVIQGGTREGTGCWTWNGSTEAPTLRPSVKTDSWQGWICHSWINDGCAHSWVTPHMSWRTPRFRYLMWEAA